LWSLFGVTVARKLNVSSINIWPINRRQRNLFDLDRELKLVGDFFYSW
jgi:hypothetical protein